MTYESDRNRLRQSIWCLEEQIGRGRCGERRECQSIYRLESIVLENQICQLGGRAYDTYSLFGHNSEHRENCIDRSG